MMNAIEALIIGGQITIRLFYKNRAIEGYLTSDEARWLASLMTKLANQVEQAAMEAIPEDDLEDEYDIEDDHIWDNIGMDTELMIHPLIKNPFIPDNT